MKASLLLILTILACITVSAQKFSLNQSDNNDRSALLQKKPLVDEQVPNPAVALPNYSPVAKTLKSAPGVVETLIGRTVYDSQTNSAVANRIYAYPDGTMAAVWTMGFIETAYADRGTGYNYFDGTNWGDEPTARIETMRTGWPSYCPLGNGEVVVAHDFVTGLRISQRPMKGTGAWTTSYLQAPAGATKLSWPRVVSTGNTLHVIVCSGIAYQGLDLALLYYRSIDGGTTWESPKIIPGLDAASLGAAPNSSFKGFGGDAYSWAEPKGDTIAFVVSAGFRGIWVMKSFDKGTTWNKTTVSEVPTFAVAPTPLLYSNDGNVAMALDNEGKAHVIFGRMGVSDADFADAAYSYRPYMDGLIYWKEGMPILDTTSLNNTDSLDAHGNLIAYMIDYSGNDTIDFPSVPAGKFPFGLYGSSLTSMGQIAIDPEGNIIVTYSSFREDLVNTGAFPNAEIYRHLYEIMKPANESLWREPMDLTGDLEHEYDECVFASLASNTNTGVFTYLNMVYQVDPEPGTAIGADADPPGDNYINYLALIRPMGLIEMDISKYVKVSPNPASEYTNMQVSLSGNSRVQLHVYDMMGRLIMDNDYGVQPTGYHSFKVATSLLTRGVYLFTVQIGNSRTSKKVVIE
jgi:hypothetical protein